MGGIVQHYPSQFLYMKEIYFYQEKIDMVSGSFYHQEDSKDDKFLIENKLSRISCDEYDHKSLEVDTAYDYTVFGYHHYGTPEELALFILNHSDMIYKIIENA